MTADGFISIDDLINAINTNFHLQLSDGLIAGLMFQCDQDRDGKSNFLKFSNNFLCYRMAQPSGLEPIVGDETKENPAEKLVGTIRDQQNRVLLSVSDLVEDSNEGFYPTKLPAQIDEMVPEGWKTSYDKTNEAPYRLERQVKRQNGVASINSHPYNAIPSGAPTRKSRVLLGLNTVVGALLSLSIWNDRGVTDDVLFLPKTMEEIRDIYANANVPLSGDDFVYAWTTAAATKEHGHVSIATFKQVLDEKRRKFGNYELVYA